MRRSHASAAIITRWLAMLALPIALQFFSPAISAHESRTTPPPQPKANATIGAPFALQDPRGRLLTDQTFRGRWLIVFFGYTSCPDVCPTTLATLTQTFGLLGGNADQLNALFVTVDPRRDTQAVLGTYMANFSPRIVAATGTPAQIDQATKAFRVRYEIEGEVRRPPSRSHDGDTVQEAQRSLQLGQRVLCGAGGRSW